MIERRELPIETLTVDAMQSREQAWTGDDVDQQLAHSIETDGLLQDIIVRPLSETELSETPRSDGRGVSTADAEYGIVAGSRRYYAAMDAGYERLPCKVMESDDLSAAWTSLVENTDRRELSEQEIAQQLKLIYEQVRPVKEVKTCPDCGTAVAGEDGLHSHCQRSECTVPGDATAGPPSGAAGDRSDEMRDRFLTDRQAVTYIADRYLGRTDADALSLVRRHLRTAELPPMLQSLFKDVDDRTAQERTALQNFGIDARTTLGSGNGSSGASREVVALHETVTSEMDTEEIDPTDAVLEAVGSLRFSDMSEQELRRTLREFRHEVSAELEDAQSASTQKLAFSETLKRCAADLKDIYEEVEPVRPFEKVDVLGPETQHHSRWHAQAMQQRDASGHGDLVRTLYQERLEELAEQEGWK